MAAVEFIDVDIIFGENPELALTLLDQGKTRQEILDTTGNILGAADASIAIERGEICVLMGLSGSGKSTLLRAVNGLNKVTRGKVLVEEDGQQVDVASCDAATLRRLRMQRIAMVFQQFALLPWRTVEENVGFGLELRGTAKSERERIVTEKLEMVGLQEWRSKYAHELSGGMQQRVGLARAFSTDADILLMDEPFSALDPLIRDHLQDELLELQRNLKKTIVFVSHDLDEALKIGNHIAIMESGRIVQYGEPEEIVLSPVNQYVADFVAHMNPLNVLRGASLMTPVNELPRENNVLKLDKIGWAKLTVNENDHPVEARVDGQSIPVRAYDEASLTSQNPATEPVIYSASPNVLMRNIIDMRHATGHPVLLIEDNKLVGVVGDEEIYRGMLRQADLAATVE